MKALIVYDSTHGNTEKVAQAVGEAIGGQVLRVDEVNPADLKGFDLLIIGSPTHGGWFTEGIQGPLKDGELERAATWARQITSTEWDRS